MRAPFKMATTLDEAEAIAPSTVVKRVPRVEASDDDAVKIELLVLVLMFDSLVVIAEASDDEAELTSDTVASDPEVRPAPVRVRVPFVQTSVTRVPKDDRVRPEADQIAAGKAAKSEEEALPTTVSVLAFTAEVTAAV